MGVYRNEYSELFLLNQLEISAFRWVNQNPAIRIDGTKICCFRIL